MPQRLLDRSSLRGNEYAWRVGDIPDVIEAARLAGFVSLGGQLQFRVPGGTCECYWVEVDTFRVVSSDLLWPERVDRTASEALDQFQRLSSSFDFLAEGRKAFPEILSEFEASGGRAEDAMCFVWYLEARQDGG